MAYNATNGGNQTAARESDTVIVPRMPCNDGGGKDGTQVDPRLRETFSIRRDRSKNGNKTG